MATAVEQTPAREPAALAASTLCEAFQITSAERPDAGRAAHAGRRSRRSPGGEYAERGRADRRRPRRARVGRGDTRRAHAGQPARVQSGRHAPRCTSARPRSRSTTPRRPSRSSTCSRTPATGGRDRAGVPAGRPAAAGAPRWHRARSCSIDADEGGTISLAELEEMERRRASTSSDMAGGRAGRRRDADLHVGHDRPAEGRQITHANVMAEVRGMGHRLPAAPRRAQGRPSCRRRTSPTVVARTTSARSRTASRSPR